MGNFNFSSFSDLSNVEISAGGSFQKDLNRLECKPENGINGMYEFFGRFLPNPYDSSKSMIQKSVVRLKNPAVSGESVTFDCPKSIYKPSFFYTMDSVLSKYADKPGMSEVVKQIRKNFSRWRSITSLMYISQDACHPENVNKIKIFQYGSAINKIIDEATRGTLTVQKFKPFDLVNGKDFHYVATIKSKALGYSDYSSCSFIPQSAPFKYFIDGQYYEVTPQELDMMSKGQETLLVKLYKEQCPDMSRYEYQEPTKDQLIKAATYVRIIFNQAPTLLQEIINVTDDREFVELLNQQGGVMQGSAMQQPTMGGMYGGQQSQPMMGGMQQQMYNGGYQQPMMGGQPQQFIQPPTVNTFGAAPQQTVAQEAYQQNPLSEGGFIPQPQNGAIQQPAAEEIQTFGGGSEKFKEAMDSIF